MTARATSRRRGRGAASAALLGAAGVAGIGIGLHGWSVRQAGVVTGGLSLAAGRSTSSPPSSAPAATKTTAQHTSASHRPSGTAHSSSPASKPAGHRSAPAASLGPALSSTPYAPYAYELYPSPSSQSNQQVLSGFSVAFHRSGPQVNFTLAVAGSGQAPVHKSYPVTDRVYFVETSLGDDSGSADYSFGDDGFIVTNASGRIVK